MTQRTAALAIATLLISGSFVQAAQAQDGEDRPAPAGGEGPRLSPRFERAERPQQRPADAPVAPAIIRQVPDQNGRAAGGPSLPPDARIQEQRGGGRGGGGRAGGGNGGSGGGRAGGGGGRGGTIIIDGSRGGGGRTQGPPPRVIQGGRRGAVVVPNRIYPYGYGGFGLGYFYYDPFWNPWGPWGYGGAWGGPWGYGGGYGYYGGGHQDDFGKVRLDVKGPKDAQVLVDGYYAGTLDDFDGAFQGLELESGTYRIAVESEGFEPLTFDTRVTDGRKITLHGALKRAEQ